MRIARIVVDLSLDRIFDYIIPERLQGQVHVGSKVKVPFNRGFRNGYVLSLGSDSPFLQRLKQIDSLCEQHTRIPSKLVELGEWMADYYCCSREQAIRTLLPHAVRSGKIKHKTMPFYTLPDPGKAEQFIADNHDKKSAAKRVELLKFLVTHKDLSRQQLLEEYMASASALATLLKSGIVIEEKRRIARDPLENIDVIPDRPQTPTEEQQIALDKIIAMLENPEPRPHTTLLFGITGSGKTEVYLQAIAKALELGRDSIVLVPEISLTPQTVQRFRARFGDMISVMHSRLTEGERFDEWNRINEGRVRIAVGARSALFSPFRHLGLIIVDEEHEPSYKQGESPRYHARDVAVMRGLKENAVVVLGSATPSFESYNNAVTGKYELCTLTKRIDRCVLPTMKIIDIRLDRKTSENKSGSFFTKMLIDAVNDRLWRGEQSILFLNRRGYARQMMCDNCGFVAQCPSCSVAYTYHRHNHTLSCHLCGDTIRACDTCPQCSSESVRYSGVGTEKIESVAIKTFKQARIARMDSDTMKSQASYEHVLNEFRRGNLDILIGTQMIAKGLHFPNVTLVGIINADQALNMPDFRAPERAFQLITQVAGRAGRGDIKGEVLLQTFSPFNPTISAAVNHDFTGFFAEDMAVREMLGYPPYGHLTALHFEGENLDQVAACASQYMEVLRKVNDKDINISEPSPAPIEKIKDKFRYMIVIRGRNTHRIRRLIRQLALSGRHPANVHVYADVDAVSLS